MSERPIVCMVGTVILLTCLVPSAAAAGSVNGTVTDSVTGAPLEGSVVSIEGQALETVTDFGGNFHLENVPAGHVTVNGTHAGYQDASATVDLGEGEAFALDFALDPTPVFLDRLVVTGWKVESQQRQSSQTINVVERSDLEPLDTETLSGGLDYVPGTTTYPNQVSIRGSQGLTRDGISRVLLLLDGIPLAPADNIGIPVEMIPHELVRRVEVLKGPGSALYGHSAMGGVVNVITRDPSIEPRTSADLYFAIYDEPREPEWRFARDTRSFFGASALHSQRLSERLNGLLLLRHDASEGFQEDTSSQNTFGYGALSYHRDRSQLRLILGYTDQERLEFFNWESADRPYIEGNFPPGWQWEVFKNRRLAAGTWNRQISSRASFSAKGRFYEVDHSDDFVNTADQTQNFHFQDSDATTFGVDLTGSMIGERFASIAGVDLQDDSLRSQTFGDHDGETVSPYVQISYDAHPRLTLQAGARYDRDKEDDLDAITELSPNAGVIFDTGSAGVLRFSYGEGFILPGLSRFIEEQQVTPTTIVRPARDLQPEKSRSYELGYSWNPSHRLFVNAAYFYTTFDNLIQKISFREGGFIIETEGNVAEATLQGLDLQLHLQHHLGQDNRLRSIVNYNYLDSWDETEDHALDYRSEHTASLLTILSHGSYDFALAYKYRSEPVFTPPPPFPDADFKTDSNQVDLHVSGRFGRFKPTLTVGNVFQDRYLSRAGWQGPPRYLKLGLRILP